MASDKPQLEILDLLYDDELDEETRAAARRDVEQSDEAREELEAFESMLAKIRDAEMDEDVPESVHDSIMASARQHAAKNASRQAQVTRRAPTVSKPATDSLWSRLNSSGVTQLVLAAAVVLVGGFIFLKIGGEQAPEQKFMAAEEAIDEEVTFGEESTNEVANNTADLEKAEPSEEEFASAPAAELDDQLQATPKESADKQLNTDRPAKKSGLGELAQLDQRAQAEEPRPETRQRSAPRARKSASRKKDSPNDEMEVFQGASQPKAQAKKRRPAPAAAEKKEANIDALLGDLDASSRSSSSSASNSGVADGADLGRSLGSMPRASDDEPSSASGVVAKSETKPVPTQAESEQAESAQEQTSSVSTMESNYRSGNFAGVVTQADRYLSRSSADQADEARVLELKARALARQGKTSEADSVYAELQKKHPSYKSEQIRRERADLSQERESKAKRRRKAPAEADDRPQLDFEQQEAADPQPSNFDNAY